MLAFLRHTFFRFIPAWVIAFVFASVLHSHFVLFELVALDIDIPASKWMSMVIDDLLGLLPSYGGIIAVTLIISFFIASRLNNFLKKHALTLATSNKASVYGAAVIFGTAGAVGFFVMLAAMQPILDVTLIAGARSNLGIAAQCFAGFVSGFVYGRLR